MKCVDNMCEVTALAPNALLAPSVEHAAVNRKVIGSIPIQSENNLLLV